MLPEASQSAVRVHATLRVASTWRRNGARVHRPVNGGQESVRRFVRRGSNSPVPVAPTGVPPPPWKVRASAERRATVSWISLVAVDTATRSPRSPPTPVSSEQRWRWPVSTRSVRATLNVSFPLISRSRSVSRDSATLTSSSGLARRMRNARWCTSRAETTHVLSSLRSACRVRPILPCTTWNQRLAKSPLVPWLVAMTASGV